MRFTLKRRPGRVATSVLAVAAVMAVGAGSASSALAVTTLEPANTSITGTTPSPGAIVMTFGNSQIGCNSSTLQFSVPASPGNVIPDSPSALALSMPLSFSGCSAGTPFYSAGASIDTGVPHTVRFNRSGSTTQVQFGLHSGIDVTLATVFGQCHIVFGARNVPVSVAQNGASISVASTLPPISSSTCPGFTVGTEGSIATQVGKSYALSTPLSYVTQ